MKNKLIYQALVTDTNEDTYEYFNIEADNLNNAGAAVRELFTSDHPDKTWTTISIRPKEDTPSFSLDLEQCPPIYRADLRMTIEEEIRNAVKIRNAIEEHNETRTRKDEYQATLEYIVFLNRTLEKLEEIY